MSSTYIGNPASITPHEEVNIEVPAGSDSANAASVNTPLEKSADLIAYLMTNAALRGAIETAVFNGVPGNDTTPALRMNPTLTFAQRKLLCEFDNPSFYSGNVKSRLYMNGASFLEATYNARWDEAGGELWYRDHHTMPSFRVRMVPNGASTNGGMMEVASTYGFDSWVEVAWARTAVTNTGLKWIGINPNDAYPPNTTAITNELRAANVCKSWGSIQITCPSGTPIPVIRGGFNATVSCPNNSTIRVTFPAAMADANYSVSVAHDFAVAYGTAGNSVVPRFTGKTTSSFDIQLWDRTTGPGSVALTQPGTSQFDFHVYGKQDNP